MKLYVVRHAQTKENKTKRVMGRTPGELSNKGKQQAEKTARTLVKENIDLIYTSPLDRCFDTAQIINKLLNKELVKDNLLIERDFGELTNTSLDTLDFEALDTPSEENTRMAVEPLSSIRKRMETFLGRVREKHTDKDLLVVSHSNPIRMLLAILLDCTYSEVLEKYKIYNCGISVFEIFDGGEVRVVKIDDVEHLS